MNINISEKSSFIWKIAELLRGDYKQSEYGETLRFANNIGEILTASADIESPSLAFNYYI